jgi:glycosyltransferase involved in cell wall biosynthesis
VRDLLITINTPALGSGQAMRTYGLIRALAEHRPTDVLHVRFGAHDPDEAHLAIADAAFHPVDSSRGALRAFTYARSRLSGTPATYARGISPELIRASQRMAAEPGRGRVIADGPIAAMAVAALSRRREVIYNAHNFESDLRPQYAAHGPSELRRLQAFERGILERASESWMVSDGDIELARSLSPPAHLRYVPNVIDVSAIEPVAPPAAEQRVVFVASFRYEPNLNAAGFLVEEVFPRVWEHLPDARLALVGGGIDEPLSSDPRVEALGFVEHIDAVYRRASCVVVPLLEGGGSPLKFVEGLAYGLPVVATPRAAAGLHVRGGEHCLIAEDAERFAGSLVEVLTGGAAEIAARGRKLAESEYSIEALAALIAP